MYIPTWLIIITAVILFLFYKAKKKADSGTNTSATPMSVEGIEEGVEIQKASIFSLEHFDSPHFIDVQNAFDAMEVNYLRLKQRFYHTPEKVLEIAKDWFRYVSALRELKRARVMLDVDWAEDAWDNAVESMKEPSITKDEIENKFKSLLGKDWQKIPPDYFKRKESVKKSEDKDTFSLKEDWKTFYRDSVNLYNLEEKRSKKQKEAEDKKINDSK